MARRVLKKGYRLEEVLRAYFIRAGIYAARGIPIRVHGEELTDVDIWLYERSTGSSRRRQIVDAKSRTKPKAVERLFWTKGLADFLEVDGAYVATTDNRPLLRRVANRLKLSVLDGTAINRMMQSNKILFADRLYEEDIEEAISQIDRERNGRFLQMGYADLKAALIDGFGPGTVNRGLDHFGKFAVALANSHPNTKGGEVCLRLAYLAASVVAVAVDATLTDASFKSAEEKRELIVNVVRYGRQEEEDGFEKVRLAMGLMEQFVPNGSALAQAMVNSVRQGYEQIPAEGIADFVVTRVKSGGLFDLARRLEYEAFRMNLAGYDGLSVEQRAFLGVLLDFSAIDRKGFAASWKGEGVIEKQIEGFADENSGGQLALEGFPEGEG